MSKYFKLFFFVTLIAVLTAGTAGAASVKVYAGGSDTSSGVSTYLLANEAYKSGSSIGVSDNSSTIHPLAMVTPNANNPQSLKFCFADSKGGFENASTGYTYYMAVWKDTTGTTSAEYTADNTVETGELLPVVSSATTNLPVGVSSVSSGCINFDTGSGKSLQYNLTGQISGGSLSNITTSDKVIVMHITGDTSTGATIGLPSTLFTTANVGFNWYVASGQTSSDVLTMQIIENSSQTYTSTFAEFMNQYVAGVKPLADAKIDVDASRMKFTNNATTDTVTVTIADRNGLATTGTPWYDGSSYLDRFLLTTSQNAGSVSDVIVDLEASNQAVSKMMSGSTTLTYDSSNSRWRITSDVSVGGSASDISFTATVDTTNVIDTRSFMATVNSSAAAGYTSYSYLSSGSAGSWTINAYQGIIPYILTLDGYETFCMVANNSGGTVDVILDLIGSEGTVSGLTNLDLGEIADDKLAYVQFDGTDITLMNGTTAGTAVDISGMGSDAVRYAGKVTVTGDQDNIWTSCIQKQGTTSVDKRIVPVLTNRTSTGVDWGN